MRALGRLALLLTAALLALSGAAAESGYWEDAADRPVVCCDGRSGCEVLQTVMMGSFADFDPSDGLTARVMSAALSALCEVTDEDFNHFCEEFSVEEAAARRLYYVAVGNCLRADVFISPDPGGSAGAARRVLMLFLEPEGEKNAEEQMRIIREGMSGELVRLMAGETGLPEDFIAYLTRGDDGHGTPA